MTHQKQHKYLSVKNKILVFTKVTMDIKLEKTDHNDEKSLYFMLTIQYLLTKKKKEKTPTNTVQWLVLQTTGI